MGRFIQTAQGQCDIGGESIVSIGVPSGVAWRIEACTVSTNSTMRTNASIYLGSPTPAALVDATYSGNRDTSNTKWDALGGEIITCVWTGGDPGSTTMLRLIGQQVP